MCEYNTPKDLEYYYTRVEDVIDSFDDFGDGSPETAQKFRDKLESSLSLLRSSSIFGLTYFNY